MRNKALKIVLSMFLIIHLGCKKETTDLPNIIIINVDDLGYGDLSCYNSQDISTSNVDRLANEGLMFTNAYSTASICTPSRYSLLTGEYYWRKTLTWSVGNIATVSIAPGNAGLIIDTSQVTIADVCKSAGYKTAAIGKWHLGLGPVATGPQDWNLTISPATKEIGFDYSFLIPATADRVPTAFFEIDKLANLDANDPIKISYDEPIGDDFTIYNVNITPNSIITYDKNKPIKGKNVVMYPSFGHDQTIVNGIPRIGYMTGGKRAIWKDDKIAETITNKAIDYISENRNNSFLLYFATNDIHVPRVPGKNFVGKSKMGVYGDVIMQMDWSVGQILNKLDELKLTDNTIIIFTSDNGPVLNDGYFDGSYENIGTHSPSGKLRGGKYSAFEGGSRIPLIIRWPEKIKHRETDALFSQVDILATIAEIVGNKKANSLTVDSKSQLNFLLGESSDNRNIVYQNMNGALSIIHENWKYIEPNDGPKINYYTVPETELGNDKYPQLYDLQTDEEEKINLATKYPEKLAELEAELLKIKSKNIK
jgi:arylsulfatase A-like enzyme